MSMAIRTIVSSTRNQMRWVVLLLTIAVILPTVCLLWLMSQAVKNERLAVRQKLIDVYKQRLEKLSTRFDELWTARIDLFEQEAAIKRQPVEMFKMLVGRDNGTGSDAIIIYDSNGKLVYPVVGNGEDSEGLSEVFNKAWDVEFVEEDFAGAIWLYEHIADSVIDDFTRYRALLGKVRCLRKLGEIEKAIALCHQLAYEQIPNKINTSSVSLIARARVLLVTLKTETREGLRRSDLQDLVSSAINYTPGSSNDFLLMPSGTRIFLLHKAIEIVEESDMKIVLQDFFSSNYLSLKNAIRRGFNLSKLVIQETQLILTKELDNLDNVMLWEEEVNKIYLLVRRQINFALHNSILLNQLGITIKDCQ